MINGLSYLLSQLKGSNFYWDSYSVWDKHVKHL